MTERPIVEDMKILLYGAGVIGSIFAGKIAGKGYDVTVLARGARYDELKEKGIILRNCLDGKTIQQNIKVIDTLNADAVYEYIIVAVQNTQIDALLPVLAKNKSPNIVFVVNNPLGYEKWIKMVGSERILIGFPAAGGERKDGLVQYFIGTGIKKLFQATTFGELDGRITRRLRVLHKLFRESGFSPTMNKNMDWWQKTHVAVILPIAKALYRYNSDNYELGKSFETLKHMVLGTRELFRVLKTTGIAITPAKLNFYYLPVVFTATVWKKVMGTKIAEYAMAVHTIAGKDEIQELERQFMTLNKTNLALVNYNRI